MEMSLKDELKRAHLFENAEQFPAMCLSALYSSRRRRDSGSGGKQEGVLCPVRKPR